VYRGSRTLFEDFCSLGFLQKDKGMQQGELMLLHKEPVRFRDLYG
jgi:hypothetical protein